MYYISNAFSIFRSTRSEHKFFSSNREYTKSLQVLFRTFWVYSSLDSNFFSLSVASLTALRLVVTGTVQDVDADRLHCWLYRKVRNNSHYARVVEENFAGCYLQHCIDQWKYPRTVSCFLSSLPMPSHLYWWKRELQFWWALKKQTNAVS